MPSERALRSHKAMSTAEMAQATRPGLPRFRTARAMASAVRGRSAPSLPTTTDEVVFDDPNGARAGVSPTDALVVPVADLDHDHGGLIPAEGAVGLGIVGGDGVGAGREPRDGHRPPLDRATGPLLAGPATDRRSGRQAP